LIPRVRQVLESRGFKIGFELGKFKFDRLPPDVTVNNLAFSGKSPDLTGTVGCITESLTVEIAGKVYQGIDNRNGTWKLPAAKLAGLGPGTYDVKVTAKNANGNTRTDASTNELTVLAPSPTGAEPADPDKHDLSVWKNINPGIHFGFGSIDVAESRSLPPPESPTKAINLHGWKGERVNCKLLVWSPTDAGTVSVRASKLASGDHEIGRKATTISVVKFVLTDEFPGGNDRKIKGRIPAHLKPDLLSKSSRFLANAQETRPVWISVNIPRRTPPRDI
jgi:hypothetical protein